MVKISTIKGILWFFSVLALILSFPIQVKFMSEWPSLFPYVGIGLIILMPNHHSIYYPSQWQKPILLELLIKLYILLTILNAGWQLTFGLITPYQFGSTIFIYIIPTIFYWYFTRRGSAYEIRVVLYALVIAGLISGIFHAYDNVLKLGFGQISDYSRDAISYSASRGQGGEYYSDSSSMRAQLNYRSFGLLQTHTVSSTITAFGIFAVLALLPARKRKIRNMIIMGLGFLMVMGLTFTSIIAFIVTILLLEYKLLALINARIPRNIIGILFMVAFMTILFFLSIPFLFNSELGNYITSFFTKQFHLATIGRGDTSYIGLVVDAFSGYVLGISAFPPGILFGDGSSTSFGMVKGGDVGFIETMARLGIPLFFAIVFGLSSIVGKLYSVISKYSEEYFTMRVRPLMIFSGCVILFVLLMELHYSTWNAKSVLPILFFSLAIYSRYLPKDRQPKEESV